MKDFDARVWEVQYKLKKKGGGGWERDVCICKELAYRTRHTAAVVEI